MRKKMVVGNWKMNYNVEDGVNFLDDILEDIDTKVDFKKVDVVVCPTLLGISEAAISLEECESEVMLGAQNMHFEENGAYTGEVSATMLSSVGVSHVILGHSERREYFCETNQTVNKKIKKAIEHDIVPIVCVGESIKQRENNETFTFIEKQIKEGFTNVSPDDAKYSIIAYEPIWAIGTGKTATSEQAEEVCKYIRNLIKDIYNEEVAENIKILYGGSVKASNAKELFSMENIDGALVGGASLKPEFVDIVKATF